MPVAAFDTNYVVYHDKSAYHLLSGGDPQLRSLGGHTLILWHTLRYFSDKVPVFNFGGSDLQPIEEHIRGFGAHPDAIFPYLQRSPGLEPGGIAISRSPNAFPWARDFEGFAVQTVQRASRIVL